MEAAGAISDYIIWGIDDSPYGPVPLSILIDWIGDQRVVADTWVFARGTSAWKKAVEMNELKDFFNPETELLSSSTAAKRFKPGSLRRIKILGEMKDAQLAHLADFLDFQEIMQHKVVVTQGEPGDAMFLVMSGELRARTMIGGRETILTTFAAGDFFGEMSLFDQGPRSADVVANVDSTVLKLSSQAFERLTREMPSLATPFLQAISRTLSARIRADNKRLTRVTQQFSASSND
ncbi:MAG: cyclic nucleotide-binding domain-containing protein [Limisphaerales bacterium]